MKSAKQIADLFDVLESITDGFAAYDGDLNAIYVNHRMADFYGLTQEYMIGRNVAEFVNKPENMQFFYQALNEKRQVTYDTHHPGHDKWYDVRLYPTRDGICVYSRDVTERKKHELEIQRLNAELERRVAERTLQLEHANKELESFAYSVSHDLRAPLRAIDGFSQALEEDAAEKLDAPSKRLLGRVRSATARMAELIDALLGLAKIARHEIHYRPVNLSEMAESLASEMHAAHPERSVTVTIEPELHASGEAPLLRAVLQNLMNNAWKFTRNAPSATISVGRAPETGEFYVRDNGAGFDARFSRQLFGAFHRLHTQDEFEGTGIGLATVARIIHRHGGAIRAEGQVGQGATFFFTLPETRTDP